MEHCIKVTAIPSVGAISTPLFVRPSVRLSLSVRLIDCYFLSFFFPFKFFITWYSASFRNVHFPSFFTKTITILGFFWGFLSVAFSWYFYHIEIRFAIEFSIKRIVKGYCINSGIHINEAFLHSILQLRQ